MKATFQDFIAENPNCKKFETNAEMQHIFREILSESTHIIAMIDVATIAKRPALVICALEIEAYFDGLAAPRFDLTDAFTKQAVGRMIKTILAPFGYVPHVQKDLPKMLHNKYFTSAMVYQLDPAAPVTLRIQKEIVACQA